MKQVLKEFIGLILAAAWFGTAFYIIAGAICSL